ncbi:MAG: nucleotidyltransferase domain-containing protein [Waddliaceae bacterium]
MFGLKKSDIAVIIDVIRSYSEVDEAIIFGSRSLKREKRDSDIDIAIKGSGLKSVASEISGRLNDESPLPYVFDIIDYATIDNFDLKSHIDRVGKSIYKKQEYSSNGTCGRGT